MAFLFSSTLFGATESVSIDTKTKKVQNALVNFGTGNTLNGTGATIIGFPGSSYTFIDSLTQSAGNVSLVNDSASPGNSKYYGTDSGGVLGFHTVTGGGGTFIGLDFTGATWQFVNASGMWTDSTSNDNFILGVLAGAQLVTPGTTNTGFGFKAFEPTQTIGQGNTGVGQRVFATTSAVGNFNTLVGSLAKLSDENISNAVGIGENVTVGDTSIGIGGVAEAQGTGSITIGYFLSGNDDDQISIGGVVDPATAGFVQAHTATLGSATTTDAFFGDTAQSNIHGNTLYLNPTPTPSPVEGRFIAGVNHHSYYYNGTTWKQLDNDTPTPTPTSTPTATATPSSTATPTPTPTATATPDVSDVAYDATSWDAVTTFAPSKNAIRDKLETKTGSGNFVYDNTPTLITPHLGTPLDGVATNLTGTATALNIGGNAATATALQNARTIGGVSFDGTGNIVPQTIQSINEATDTTCFPLFISASGSQSLQPLNNTALTFNSNTGAFGATSFSGAGTGLTGTAASLTAGSVTTNANLTGAVTSSGNATSLGSFTSANLRTALTDENGTGVALFDSSTSATFITPLLGTPTSGDLRNCSAATDSVAGVMSSADHTTLTSLSTATATGVAPAFTGVGVPVTGFKSGIDLKTNATTDIFTVPTSRVFVCTSAIVIPTTVTASTATTFTFKIQESGASGAMTTAVAAANIAAATTKFWSQNSVQNATGPYFTCAAGNKVQLVISAGAAGTTVTGSVFVFGYYIQ